MLIYKTGDILKAEENIICHQVNTMGIMGGGLAKQVATQFPIVEQEYQHWCKLKDYDYTKLQGDGYIVKVDYLKFIENCFTQKPNFDTDYKAIEKCFRYMLELCKYHGYTIAVPFNYGCGIANGKWEDVENIFKILSYEYGVDINIYKLEEIC